MHVVVTHIVASQVTTGNTFTVAYPTGYSRGSFLSGTGHAMVVGQMETRYPDDFGLAFGASNITVTWRGGYTIPANTTIRLQLDLPGTVADLAGVKIAPLNVIRVNLGSPIATDTDSLIKAATGAELPDSTPTSITYTAATAGTSPVDGVNSTWELDVARNITATVTHGSNVVAMTIKVTGTDIYGAELYEELSIAATGTSQTAAGKKAFKTVSSIELYSASDATANTVNIGHGDVLGLPVFLQSIQDVRAERVNQVETGKPVIIPEIFNQTDTLAGTAHTIVSPIAGTITACQTVTTVAVGTGADVTWDIGGVAVTGGTATVANSAAVGDNDIGVPSAANTVAKGSVINITPGAAFATSGALLTLTHIAPTYDMGTFVVGDLSNPTATTGDIRGTYDPAVACDGDIGFEVDLILAEPTYLGGQQYTI